MKDYNRPAGDRKGYEDAQAIMELVRRMRENPKDTDAKQMADDVLNGADPVWQLKQENKDIDKR
jgi:hypothetical protein